MPILYPTLEDIVNRMRSDFKNSLTESDPFLPDSFVDAFVFADAARFHDIYTTIERLQFQLFITTATGEFLERSLESYGITRNAATSASGNITVTGIPSSSIPVGSELKSQSNITYITNSTEQVNTVIQSVSSLVRSGNTVTATTTSPHVLATGVNTTISGANETEYNGTFEVVVLSTTSFSFTISGSPSTPATGSILSSIDSATINITADDFGQITNLEPGAQLNFSTPLPGIDNSAYVQFTGLSGETDIESDNDLRSRGLSRIQDPVANFNASDISDTAKEVSGVTRVFVENIMPEVGQVTVYFTRDNDASIIPDPNEVLETREQIKTIYPAHSADVDLFVLAPSPVIVDFTFTSITPDTSSMKDAITANLEQFFKEKPTVGVDITQISYNSIIYSTIDPETGQQVQTFVLSNPASDVIIPSGSIGILGSVTFT